MNNEKVEVITKVSQMDVFPEILDELAMTTNHVFSCCGMERLHICSTEKIHNVFLQNKSFPISINWFTIKNILDLRYRFRKTANYADCSKKNGFQWFLLNYSQWLRTWCMFDSKESVDALHCTSLAATAAHEGTFSGGAFLRVIGFYTCDQVIWHSLIHQSFETATKF